MKRGLLLIFAITCLFTRSSATMHMVTVQDFSFSPSTIPDVHPHDTIMWMWVSGTHTTTSTSAIPAGATPWNSNITSASLSFMYVPTALGTYNYNCTIHPTIMIASFTVVSATGVPSTANDPIAELFPNPAGSTLSFKFTDTNIPAQVNITDVCGRQAASINLFPFQNSTINIQNIPDGLYFVKIIQGEMVMTRRIAVSH